MSVTVPGGKSTQRPSNARKYRIRLLATFVITKKNVKRKTSVLSCVYETPPPPPLALIRTEIWIPIKSCCGRWTRRASRANSTAAGKTPSYARRFLGRDVTVCVCVCTRHIINRKERSCSNYTNTPSPPHSYICNDMSCVPPRVAPARAYKTQSGRRLIFQRH